MLSAHIVGSKSIVHGGEVNIRFALLHVGLIQGLWRVKLNLVLHLARTLGLLGFLDHQLHVSLRKLLAQLSLWQFRVNADLLDLVVERVVAEHTERLICLRHFCIVMQKDEKYCSEAFCDIFN